VVQRERARRVRAGDPDAAARLDAEWPYAGLDTCATDGMCATACPVEIDTGAYVARLRAEGRSFVERAGADLAARNYGGLVTLGRIGVHVGHALGVNLPAGGHAAPAPRRAAAPAAVYFPSCTGRVFAGGGDPLLALAMRAGVGVTVPPGLDQSCCGLSFSSKGFPDAGRRARQRTRDLLLHASDGGTLPIVVEGSSCGAELMGVDGLRVLDSVSFARREILPRLTIRRRLPDAALHITCGARHLAIEDDLRALAAAVAERVTVPLSNGCCGFAGDRGFTHPELTASATAPMAAELLAAGHTVGLTSNLPCGIGMTRACGLEFRSILAVLEELSR
jgi:D-lactate dehydrogenase